MPRNSQRFLIVIAFLLIGLMVKAIPTIRLQAGIIIRESVIIARENYNLNADAPLVTSLIVIEGENIVIDFNHSVLQGSNDKVNPNEFYGVAIRIKKGSKNNYFFRQHKQVCSLNGVTLFTFPGGILLPFSRTPV